MKRFINLCPPHQGPLLSSVCSRLGIRAADIPTFLKDMSPNTDVLLVCFISLSRLELAGRGTPAEELPLSDGPVSTLLGCLLDV